MKVTIVVAVSTNNVIGNHGTLPWRLPEDMQRFRRLTMGKPVIMGRVTFDAIGRALPGRRNIVISRQHDLEVDGGEVAGSPDTAVSLVHDDAEVMIIGGGHIYRVMLPRTDRIEMTRVHATIDGDTFFPELEPGEWRVVSSEVYPADESRPVGFTFETLERELVKNRP